TPIPLLAVDAVSHLPMERSCTFLESTTMSASICWEPVPSDYKCLDVAAPQYFLETMRKCFGEAGSWTLGRQDIPVLRGAAAAGAWGSDDDYNPFKQLIKLLEVQDLIRVWAEY